MTIMKGIAFDWCLSGAAFDMHERLDEIMVPYLKSIQTARKAMDAGLELKALQLGGVPAEAGRKIVFQAVALNDADVADLTHMADAGCQITLQVVPEEAGMTLADALKKYNS